MLSYSPSWYLECFDMPEDERPFANSVSWVLGSFGDLPLQNGHLHFELVHLVFEKEEFPGFGVGTHGDQSFQAAFSDPSRESGREQRGFYEERDGGVEDVEVLCHGTFFKAPGNHGSRFEHGIAASDGVKCEQAAGEGK